ncbi:DUF3786 domain-containing protein [bacterium]|nr:MAG: DUF3786 domain-containing protein [bacterium]
MAAEEKTLYVSSETIHPLHWERLTAQNPEEVAERSLARWDGEKFTLSLLGKELVISPADRRIFFTAAPNVPAGFHQGLTAISYLWGATGSQPSGEFVSLLELPGGATFFHGHHAPATRKISERFGASPAEFRKRTLERGWSEVAIGDGSASILALPKIPLQLVLWAADEGFASSAIFLIDSRAGQYMQLDAIWALTNCAVEQLLRD